MKSSILIGLMTVVWIVLMVNIILQGTEGKWYIEDAEKIGKLEVAKYTNQIIVVAVSDEGANLCFFERKNSIENVLEGSEEGETSKVREKDKESGYWQLVLETEVLIGWNGLGKTREGDGKTPVGVFRFTNAFGILENPGAKIEYTQVDERHYWVDDSESRYYNQFISIDEVKKDWDSAEHICKFEESYHYVLATSYNIERIPGAGSAVFLHCTSEDAKATAGCIAIPEKDMRELMKNVEPQCILIIDKNENVLNY